MLMTIKNKITLGFINLMKSAKDKGGIPDRIDLPPREAYDLLRELNTVKEVRAKYTFEQDEAAHDIKLRLFGDPPSTEEFTAIANDWFKGKLKVFYEEIPLFIVVPPKEPTPKPKRDRRFVRKLKIVR